MSRKRQTYPWGRKAFPSPASIRRNYASKCAKWNRQYRAMARKVGKTVWTRQLVSVTRTSLPNGDVQVEKRVYFAFYPDPAFKCTFLGEDGEKHLHVEGPDGKRYTVHKCYAGSNPAVTVPFTTYPVAILEEVRMSHVPGTSYPDDTTEDVEQRSVDTLSSLAILRGGLE